MAKGNEHEDWSLSVSSYATNSIDMSRDEMGDVKQKGNVTTAYGYVIVLSVASRHPFTIMDFMHGSRLYRRRWDYYFQPTYLVTLAKRFAADVVAANP